MTKKENTKRSNPVDKTENIFDAITFDEIVRTTQSELSIEDICKIIAIHLYDVVLVSKADQAKIKAAHTNDSVERPKVDRLAGGRKVSAYQVWLKAQALTKQLTGKEVKFESKSLNNPKQIAGRMASMVSKYEDFIQNKDAYTSENAEKLKAALKI